MGEGGGGARGLGVKRMCTPRWSLRSKKRRVRPFAEACAPGVRAAPSCAPRDRVVRARVLPEAGLVPAPYFFSERG